MTIDRPIFIIGSGRSGTTLMLKLLTKHPDLAWFSNYANDRPDRPWIMALSHLWDLPVLGSKIAGRIPGLLHSDETMNIYRYCGIHDLHFVKRAILTEEDVTPQAASRFTGTIGECQRYRGKSRFVNKNTNNCARIRYLKAIFPDARFIHIIRDGRAVVNSLIHVDWWPDLTLWWSGFTPNDWKSDGRAPVELCAQHWRYMVDSVLSTIPYLDPGQYIEVRYEELAANPIAEMRRLIEFCDLRWTQGFVASIQKAHIHNYNYKWQEQLSQSDQIILQSSLSEFLGQLGYAVDN